MIQVKRLSKQYPARAAVQNVSFQVTRGEVVGFLGPNGAGKSTTMRMLAGYVAPTSGTIKIDGLDIFDHPIETRRKVGYLPEHCPLYPEMRVIEFLRFYAKLKGVPQREVKRDVEKAMSYCDLTDEKRRVLGQLSKGFRQRVGIAGALLGSPDLLILDEPTVGLDPHQISQIRKLVRDLAQEKTILLSTHIMQEVEAVCDRVLIINNGKIVASDTQAALHNRLARGAELVLEARDAESALTKLAGLELRAQVAMGDGWVRYRLGIENADLRESLCSNLVQAGVTVRELHQLPLSLEGIFMKLTKTEEK